MTTNPDANYGILNLHVAIFNHQKYRQNVWFHFGHHQFHHFICEIFTIANKVLKF